MAIQFLRCVIGPDNDIAAWLHQIERAESVGTFAYELRAHLDSGQVRLHGCVMVDTLGVRAIVHAIRLELNGSSMRTEILLVDLEVRGIVVVEA